MRTDDYVVRRGLAASWAESSAKRTHAGLYDLPYAERRDDGAVILHAGIEGVDAWMPRCGDCKRGHLQWAEAGYVAWHRICDWCGSHWDLHPLGSGIAYPEIPADEPAHMPPSMRPTVTGPPSTWIDYRGYVPIDPDEEIPNSGRPWRELIALVTPEHIAAAKSDRSRQAGGVACVPACWARRARFYR